MRLLLDTHMLLWALGDTSKLGADRERVVRDPSNAVYVSALTFAEIAIKQSLGKLEVPADIADQSVAAGFTHLPYSATHADALRELPYHHRDPFDRMLVAQAMAEGLVFATADERCRAYDVRVL